MSASRLVFATRNAGKVVELRALLAETGISVLSLDELDVVVPEVVEDGLTFVANASKKAIEVSRAVGGPALADDSGLEVDALGGQPGVYSARFAGTRATDDDNNQKLLALLRDVPEAQRGARFRSALALADTTGKLKAEVLLAEGVCEGRILETPRGSGGFGYDPIFWVEELQASFAELGVGSKNDKSHRAQAMRALRPNLLAYFGLQ